ARHPGPPQTWRRRGALGERQPPARGRSAAPADRAGRVPLRLGGHGRGYPDRPVRRRPRSEGLEPAARQLPRRRRRRRGDARRGAGRGAGAGRRSPHARATPGRLAPPAHLSDGEITMTLALAALLALSPVASPPLPHRVAVLVGANQPGPGRRPLQHAHHDAEQMAEVLAAVGRFPAEQIHVLRDPTPDQVLALLQRSAALLRSPDSLLYFYYSGHADDQALYPAGKPLPLAALRAALDASGAVVRLGLVDACRGGAWTRAKGLV